MSDTNTARITDQAELNAIFFGNAAHGVASLSFNLNADGGVYSTEGATLSGPEKVNVASTDMDGVDPLSRPEGPQAITPFTLG